tara:strand:+ start:488 stop:1243 length:756 start_codon:yes stop_codon:yes gene_type:complete
MEIIKTMPESLLNLARGEFDNAGTAAAQAFVRADQERARIIQRLLDYAVSEGVSAKVAVPAIMSEVVKPCTLTKEEQKQGQTPLATGKLAYSTGAAYAKSMDIAMTKGKPFAVGLYAAHLKEAQGAKEAAHAAKLIAAETLAAEKAAEAKALATKAAKAKASEETRLAAAQAKIDAEKAQAEVRKAIDAAPISQKTGGRKSAPKSGPIKALTRHEVALHATALVAMLESIGELSVASEVREILTDNNLLNM